MFIGRKARENVEWKMVDEVDGDHECLGLELIRDRSIRRRA